MEKILFINSCMHEDSRTLRLAECILGKLQGEVHEISLADEHIMSLGWSDVLKRNACSEKEDFSDSMFEYARDFAQADEIVLAAPYWDLMFPSIVRIYFELVTVCGLTFRYTSEGSTEGLCRAKKFHYVTTSGGPIGKYNLGYDYVAALCDAFYKIPEIICYRAENLDVAGADVSAILEDAKKNVQIS